MTQEKINEYLEIVERDYRGSIFMAMHSDSADSFDESHNSELTDEYFGMPAYGGYEQI